MQDSWMLLKSDSISWRKMLNNCHNSQIQWLVVSTLCQETKEHRNQKVGSEGTPKLDPYWKLPPVVCTANMELRSESCLWTKTILTPGSESLMAQTNWSRLWTTQWSGNLRSAVRMTCVEIECEWFCMSIKGQSKATKTRTCQFFHKNNTYWGKIFDRCWTRSEKMMVQLNSGESKTNLQKKIRHFHHWCDDKWKKSMAGGGGGTKERYQYCTDSSGAILYLRALQGRSGRSLIDPTLQNNVVIPDGFFKYIYHVGCAINLHSIINSYLEVKIWATDRQYRGQTLEGSEMVGLVDESISQIMEDNFEAVLPELVQSGEAKTGICGVQWSRHKWADTNYGGEFWGRLNCPYGTHSWGDWRVERCYCKDNTWKDPFSQCELYKEFAYRSKLSEWPLRQELKLTTWSTVQNPTMCEVTWNTWGTRECERRRGWCRCMSLHAL